MYEHHYGLTEAPFALLPDPSFLYMSKDHSMALTLLRYSILNKQGFTVISGEIGSGKTTLINRILDELEVVAFLWTAATCRRFFTFGQ